MRYYKEINPDHSPGPSVNIKYDHDDHKWYIHMPVSMLYPDGGWKVAYPAVITSINQGIINGTIVEVTDKEELILELL